MFFQSFLQDLRIGLRVLVKEKMFCILAVTVLALGICGVTTQFTVVGIRMALGADSPVILRMVMSQGAWQLVIGLFIGIGGTALLLWAIGAENLRNFLFRVNTFDTLWIYSAVAALLSTVAAVSCFVPARRATRVNPIVALRAE